MITGTVPKLKRAGLDEMPFCAASLSNNSQTSEQQCDQ